MTLLGAALGVGEKKAVRTVCDANSLDVQFNEDVRDLLHALVSFECAGMIVGDKATANARAAETNRAMLKRIRSHPKGKDLPVLCLAEWPDREHVVQLAQLGVRDVIGLPCKPDVLRTRLEAFIVGTLQRHAGQAA
jgi:response regulator RpfG family c-di-GMP phosphodiesterase